MFPLCPPDPLVIPVKHVIPAQPVIPAKAGISSKAWHRVTINEQCFPFVPSDSLVNKVKRGFVLSPIEFRLLGLYFQSLK